MSNHLKIVAPDPPVGHPGAIVERLRKYRAPQAVSEVVRGITERMLKLELARALQDLGPQKTAQIVVKFFRLNGMPKELRRHL